MLLSIWTSALREEVSINSFCSSVTDSFSWRNSFCSSSVNFARSSVPISCLKLSIVCSSWRCAKLREAITCSWVWLDGYTHVNLLFHDTRETIYICLCSFEFKLHLLVSILEVLPFRFLFLDLPENGADLLVNLCDLLRSFSMVLSRISCTAFLSFLAASRFASSLPFQVRIPFIASNRDCRTS